MKRIILLFLLFVVSELTAWSICPQQLTPVKELPTYDKLVSQARKGDMDAQYQLGDCYSKWGITFNNVKQDYEEAFKWYMKAAKQGHSGAQAAIGLMYLEGYGVEKDEKAAIEWYQKAAEQGDFIAWGRLGYVYYTGKGGQKDLTKSFECYLKAANSNLAEAMYMVGRMYYTGEGVSRDIKQSISWLLKPADNYVPSQALLGKIYLYDDEVKDYTKAAEWNQKAAAKKDAGAMYLLGYQYANGYGVAKYTTKAQELFLQAAQLGEVHAMNYLGEMAMKGIGTAKDKEKAKEWFNKALVIAPDYEEAKNNLAKLEAGIDDEENNQSVASYSTKTKSEIYAVIVGNEKYKNEVEVPFAENDAKAIRDYLVDDLGVEADSHIKYVTNAGLNDMLIAVNWLENAMMANGGHAKAIFYYAGHGIPNESDQSAYLLPVDGIGSMPRSALSLKELYESFSKMKAESVTVFLDACFSGSKRENGMLSSARGVAIKAKQDSPEGKMIVFTAAQGDETAYPLTEQKHGMFTYYLLKKLQETDGDVTYGELSDYVKDQVCRQSFLKNNKMQTPSIMAASSLKDLWREMTIK